MDERGKRDERGIRERAYDVYGRGYDIYTKGRTAVTIGRIGGRLVVQIGARAAAAVVSGGWWIVIIIVAIIIFVFFIIFLMTPIIVKSGVIPTPTPPPIAGDYQCAKLSYSDNICGGDSFVGVGNFCNTIDSTTTTCVINPLGGSSVTICSPCSAGCTTGVCNPTPPAPPSSTYRPPLLTSDAVDNAVHSATTCYNLPRWFYYAIIHRETSFNPTLVNTGNGGVGLTQLTGPASQGMPYPEYLSAPDNSLLQWQFDMGLKSAIFDNWINMNDVSQLTNPFDPLQNLKRFSSGYAAPAFYLFKSKYGLDDTNTLRAVAYHWNHGLPYDSSLDYDPNESKYPADEKYLPQYDTYVATYKPPVEADDGVWSGLPTKPPYACLAPTPTEAPTPTPCVGESFVCSATDCKYKKNPLCDSACSVDYYEKLDCTGKFQGTVGSICSPDNYCNISTPNPDLPYSECVNPGCKMTGLGWVCSFRRTCAPQNTICATGYVRYRYVSCVLQDSACVSSGICPAPSP